MIINRTPKTVMLSYQCLFYVSQHVENCTQEEIEAIKKRTNIPSFYYSLTLGYPNISKNPGSSYVLGLHNSCPRDLPYKESTQEKCLTEDNAVHIIHNKM